VRPGEIYRHASFYLDRESGETRPKFFLVLGKTPAGDIVARLLTSRQNGRPEVPPCYHGDPYPGFYVGVLGEPLTAKSWVDLRSLEDFDEVEATGLVKKRIVGLVKALPAALMRPLLECVAGAPDTTKLQERSIRDSLSTS